MRHNGREPNRFENRNAAHFWRRVIHHFAEAALLIAEIEHGILVTELIGQGVNGITGDYSRGAAGFLIEKGEITRPVSEITIASNLKDMFRARTPANDLEFRYGINAPTLRIDGMTIAGD